LANYSSHFIQKNPSQIRKNITSRNPSAEESTIYFHSDTDSDNSMNLEKVIKRIREHSGAEESLLVIARYNSSLPSDSFIKERWTGPFDIRTVHRSKGSEADYVVVVDLKQDFRGFPSTIEDDPILEMIMPRNDQYEFAEERRLFYVAMTRARKECHLITPASQPSLFAVELKNDDIGVTYGKHDFLIQRCPVCSSGILTISNFDGGSHCSNSPHCEFRASKCHECNQRLQVKTMNPFTFTCKSHPHTEVVTCPGCHWGVLREIEGPYGTFLGCSNYGVIQCNGKTKSKKRVTMGWNKNYTQKQH
jgi:DNA helicase-4